ncbi:MAG: transketolase C-terminal domain-containing protein [Planctomycetota bacterium]
MRNRFAATIEELAAVDERVVLLSGDIGNRLFNRFKERFPDRFYNCGVAEQNMVSVAAGLALSGLRPVAYTIAPFLTTRALEQIKIDLCYHNAPVVLVGVGAGLSYASLGPTHHTLDDIAQLRSLPGLTIMAPGDAPEVQLALESALSVDGPVYLRIGKKNEPVVHAEAPPFKIGESIPLRAGSAACLLSTGTILPEAVAAAEDLAQQGIEVALHSVPTVQPLAQDWLASLAKQFAVIVTIEEHAHAGGFGAAIAEAIADADLPVHLVRIAAPDQFHHDGGTTKEARLRCGLSASQIAHRVKAAYVQRAH